MRSSGQKSVTKGDPRPVAPISTVAARSSER
jgi:hypothetical protein